VSVSVFVFVYTHRFLAASLARGVYAHCVVSVFVCPRARASARARESERARASERETDRERVLHDRICILLLSMYPPPQRETDRERVLHDRMRSNRVCSHPNPLCPRIYLSMVRVLNASDLRHICYTPNTPPTYVTSVASWTYVTSAVNVSSLPMSSYVFLCV